MFNLWVPEDNFLNYRGINVEISIGLLSKYLERHFTVKLFKKKSTVVARRRSDDFVLCIYLEKTYWNYPKFLVAFHDMNALWLSIKLDEHPPNPHRGIVRRPLDCLFTFAEIKIGDEVVVQHEETDNDFIAIATYLFEKAKKIDNEKKINSVEFSFYFFFLFKNKIWVLCGLKKER